MIYAPTWKIVLDISCIAFGVCIGSKFRSMRYRRLYRNLGPRSDSVKHDEPKMMSYREFSNWCNERAADGCWSLDTAMQCIDVLTQIQAAPWFLRNYRWRREFNVNNVLYKTYVKPTNDKIKEYKGQRSGFGAAMFQIGGRK